MVRELVHDPILLGIPSREATRSDEEAAQDLADTLIAHWDRCVGMAANMIGVHKRIIAFRDDASQTGITVWRNPVILEREEPYPAQEGCLSLLGGERPCTRYQKIRVRYQNAAMQVRTRTMRGYSAQIVQHEIDHCDGVLI